ncbi:MAG: hypothetical protein K940chlam9_01649 [Chlamydiae bacterium]|nr:hypothetical protein [Chlamydiota bacterium]
MKVWTRYFFLEGLKMFLLVFLSFYFLYILVDFSAHSKAFSREGASVFDPILYYCFQLAKRGDLLLPLALLLATIKVLTTSTIRSEIVALASGGLGLKKILRPFLFLGIGVASLLYLNYQFFQPLCLEKIESFEDRLFHSKSNSKVLGIQSLSLANEALLLYYKYDLEKEEVADAYYLLSSDHLFRIQTLFPFSSPPKGALVEELERGPDGEFERTSVFEERLFPELSFSENDFRKPPLSPRWQSLSSLYTHTPWGELLAQKGKMQDHQAKLVTAFLYKALFPLLCFLAILGPAPFCLSFQRGFSPFPVYAISLFGFITFFTCVNACVILGESQVVSPLIAVSAPFLLFSIPIGWNIAKL